MGTYEIPRKVKGEGRILYVFTTKSLMWTAGTGMLGLICFFILKKFGLTTMGIIVTIIFAALGFAIGTLKVPAISGLKFTQQTKGENIDDIILRAVKFKMKNKRIYIYKGGKK